MKKSHKREIFMARVIFAIFLVVVALIVALAVLLVSSHLKKDKAPKESPNMTENTADNQDSGVSFEPGTEGISEELTEPEVEVEQKNYRWTTTRVNFRTEPNTSCDVIESLAEGTEVEWQSEENGWAAVTYNGKSGYISTEYLTDVDPDGADEQTSDDQTSDDQAANSTREYEDASQVAIVIDPGHQTNGDNTREANGPGSSTMKARVTGGTTGVASGVPEYQLNLDISLLLKKELENRGYTVYLTRSTNDVNISNKERAEYASEVGADISVRIHANGSEDKNISGALTLSPSSENEYVADLADESMRLSQCILESYCRSTGLKNQGCTTSDTMTGINWSTVPVTILEMGYMSNETEDLLMQDSDFRIKMVQGIANGIDDYYGF